MTPLPDESESVERTALEALRGVIDPELGDSVVDLGMVRSVGFAGGVVTVEVALTVAGCPLRAQIRSDVERCLLGVAGVAKVVINVGSMSPDERAKVMARARLKAQELAALRTDLPATARVLAIASGKGGVGKSSVTVNLAVALAAKGCTVGVLDADVWGHSIPRLLGMEGEIEARDKKMVPLSLEVGGGLLRVVSMGFLSGEDEAIMWRGLVLNRAVQHFLEDVHWGNLDYLLVDLPPGTGDVQMGLARMMSRTEVLLVTTPPLAAQKVAGRAADMARKGHLRIAGVIENMSGFVCDHGQSYALFGEGGGERLADELGVPLVGRVPIDPAVSLGGDSGSPVSLAQGPGGAGEAFREIAGRVLAEIAPRLDMSGCSARLLERVEQALGVVEQG